MKNILARGGIEFLAVLLGISLSLWIDKRNDNAKMDKQIADIHGIVDLEVDKIISYTDSALLKYNQQGKNINILFNSWDSFSINDVNNPDNFQNDIYVTTSMQFLPPLATLESLKSDGRFNLIDDDVRKLFGEFYELMKRIKNVERKEDDYKEKLLTYMGENHSQLLYDYPLYGSLGLDRKNRNNFMLCIEKTRSDKTIFTILTRKCFFSTVRNRFTKKVKDNLYKIKKNLTRVNNS